MNRFEQYISDKYNVRGQEWLYNLPDLTAKIKEKYHLSNLEPVSNLSINYIVTGWQKNKAIILKMSIDTEGLKREAIALKNLPKMSVPKIFAEEDGMLLMEKLTPGMTLKEYINSQPEKIKNSNKRIEISCRLIEQIHKNSLPLSSMLNSHNFPHIKDQLNILNQEWNDLPSLYVNKARALKDKLSESLQEKQTPLVFLHGDLHYENIILSKPKNDQDEQWFAIDPKGVIGYPINEVWASIMDIKKDSIYIAEYFGFDLSEVREWYFVHLMLVSCWCLEDKSSPEQFIKIAAEAFALIS